MVRKSHVSTVAVVAVATLFVCGVQAQTTTGRIVGTVTEASGQSLPGVTITISSPALIGGAQTRITDKDGGFQFVSLHPGEYNVKAELAGFVSQERQEVRVPLGGAASLDIVMPEGRFEGSIEVRAETPVVDPTQVNTEQIFDQSFMQNAAVGSDNRDYLLIVNQAAGVTGGDNPNVFGSTLAENVYYIDGLDTTDPVASTWGTLYNFDAIAEVEIQTSGFEAEYGRATGGLVNLVTKSGGNDFSGTLDIRYSDSGFQESGDHYDASSLDSSYQDIAATLGGPIARDKLWFFVAYEFINSEQTPVDSPATRDFEGQNYNVKLTWQAASKWRLVARASGDPAEIANDNASQFVTPEAMARQKQGADVYAIELNAVVADNLIWNTVAGAYRSPVDVVPMSGDLQTASHFDYATFLTTANYPNQQYTKRNRDDLATDLTWFLGDLAGSHELKLGFQYSGTDFPGASCYTGTDGGACSPGTAGYSYEDFAALPYFMWEGVTGGVQDYEGKLYTAYVQDSWRVLPNLTLKVGVRHDQVSYDNNASREIADMSKTQPRFGVAWDITNDAKNVVRGNWGRFMHPASLTLPYVLRAGNEPAYLWSSCMSLGGIYLGIT
ncbi:MAG: TonB-dependent receptor, partial [Acidobacteriota bacterium]